MPADALPPIVPAFELSVASRGMSKGILQSDDPQLLVRGALKRRQLQLGGQWKNISTNAAKGEASLFGGWNGSAGKVDLSAQVAYKWLTSATGAGNRGSLELTGTAARKFGRFALRASAQFSPNDFGATDRSLYVEGGPSVDLSWRLRASAAIGFRERRNARDYTSFNIGISRPLAKGLSVDLRVYDSDRGELGETYQRRVVGTLKLAI